MRPHGLRRHRLKGFSRSLHGRIASRLLVAWIALSALAGTFTYVLEQRQLDAFVSGLVAEEARSIRAHLPARAFEVHLEGYVPTIERTLEASHFIGIRLYGADQQLRLERWRTLDAGLANDIAAQRHHFFASPTREVRNYLIDRRLYIQSVHPLSEGSHVYGYMEGIYRVDAQVMAALVQRIGTRILAVISITTLTCLIFYPIILSLNRRTIQLADDLMQTDLDLLQTIGSAIAKRDSDTDAHNYRVTLYAVRLAEALGLRDGEIRSVVLGAFLHDVGKIGIPDRILLKPGNLTPEETTIMRTHVELGADIVSHSAWLRRSRDVVLGHHERYDGTGFPRGFTGEAIPLAARLFAVVDVFDALTSRRPYKEPFPFDKSMRMLRAESGSHFDPVILEVFEKVAWDCYGQFYGTDEGRLQDLLRGVVETYFSAEDLSQSGG
jgi:HD-GYP domain-containing protein (c-di-GMP phosphodiesterase class II)